MKKKYFYLKITNTSKRAQPNLSIKPSESLQQCCQNKKVIKNIPILERNLQLREATPIKLSLQRKDALTLSFTSKIREHLRPLQLQSLHNFLYHPNINILATWKLLATWKHNPKIHHVLKSLKYKNAFLSKNGRRRLRVLEKIEKLP